MNKTNIKNLVVRKSLPIILAGTMVFSLASCGKDYKYNIDWETGSVVLVGLIPYEELIKWHVLTYDDLNGNINVMLLRTVLQKEKCIIYNAEIDIIVAEEENIRDVENGIASYANRVLGETISIENFDNYLQLYEIKGGYSLEDLKQIKTIVKETKNKDNKVLVKE